MTRLAGWVIAGLLCLGLPLGCAPARLAGPRLPFDSKLPGPVALPSIGTPTPVDLASLRLPDRQAVEKALGNKAEITGYRLLTESQCQHLAAAESTLANLLASERQSVLTGVVGRRDRESVGRSVLADVLGLRAIEERNRSAAEALELYYRLAAAYFARDRLDHSLAEIRQWIEELHKAKETGLTISQEDSKLQAQQIQLIDRKVQLDAAIEQLDDQLCQLLGLERDPSQPLWPGAEFAVRVAAVDAEAAVDEGLRSRPDLALLALLNENVDEQTLGAIRGALGRNDPLLGRPAPRKHMISTAVHRARICLEAETRQEQLGQLLDAQRRAAEVEIRRAAAEVDRRLRQIGLAKEKLEQSEKALHRLRERREAKGSPGASEVRAAQLEVLNAEVDAFQAVVEWKIATVRLKQTQGLLAAECGYALPDASCPMCPRPEARG
jgi:hypothetical protein